MKERMDSESRRSYTPEKLTAAVVLSLGLVGCMAVEADDPEKIQEAIDNTRPINRARVESQVPALEPAAEPSPSTEIENSHTPTPTPSPELENSPPLVEVAPPEKSRVISCMVARCVALTFDDGPGEYTNRLLDYLEDYEAKATFFLVGSRLDRYGPVVSRIYDDGHQIGSHSWKHDRLTELSVDEIADDTNRTNEAITSITGLRPGVMRPPYGATDDRVEGAVGMPQIMWSVDPEDWKYRNSEYVSSYITENTERGDIVLLHDIHETSVEAVPDILEDLTEDGYELVTVDTLLGESLPTGTYSQQQVE